MLKPPRRATINSPMEILRDIDHLPTFRHAVATIGSYDGVHRGHATLLGEVVRRAQEACGESIVITFEPHPRITLGNDEGLQLLSTLEEKAELLTAHAIDYLIVIPFDETFSRLSHDEFTRDYLMGRLNIKELVVGYNHRFGHDKQGGYTTLITQSSIRVVEIARQTADGDKVSSTVVRQALNIGDMVTAQHLLGHPYTIIGECNDEGYITLDRYKLLPPIGEYITRINDNISKIEVLPDRRLRCHERVARRVKIEFL